MRGELGGVCTGDAIEVSLVIEDATGSDVAFRDVVNQLGNRVSHARNAAAT